MSGAKKTASAHYTMAEVAKHTNPNDALWMVIDGNVLDLTAFFEEHPGGQDILRNWAGKDATMVFHSSHSKHAKQLAKDFVIGKVVGSHQEEGKCKASNKSGKLH